MKNGLTSIVVALGIAGCVHQITMPDGRPAYHKVCGGVSKCYGYMGNVCPQGYSILENSCVGPSAVGNAVNVNVNVGEGKTTSAPPMVACRKSNVIFRCK